MLRSLCAALLAGMLLSGAVLAQDKPAPTDSHLAAAVDMLQAMNAQRTFMAVIDSMSQVIIGQVKQQHSDADDKSLNAFKAAFAEEMQKESADLMKMQAAVYAEHFSESDLKALAQFYRSDVGKRFIDEQPAIIKEISPLAMKWGMAAGRRAAEHAMEKLKQEGITL